MKRLTNSALAITAILMAALSSPSYAAVAGMPCQKSEIGKTEIDDNQQFVIGCLKTDDEKKQMWKAFSGSNTMFSLTCDDWSDSGWNSKDECIADGRWHLVYSHDAHGYATYGSLATLKKYIEGGADIKSGDEEGIHYCQEVVMLSPITCLDSSRIAGTVLDPTSSYHANDGKIAIGAAARRVDGARINANISPNNGSSQLQINTLLRDTHAMNWYVKY